MPFWLGLCALFGLYTPARLLGGTEEYAAVVKTNTFGIVGLIIISFMLDPFHPLARGWFVLAWVLSIVLMGGARFLFRRVIFGLRRYGLFIERAVIAGVNDQGQAIAAQLGTDGGWHIVGFLDDYLPVGTKVGDDLRVLGSPVAVETIAHEHNVSQVIVIANALTWESFQHIIRDAGGPSNGYQVALSPGFYELLTTNVQVSHRAFVPLLTIDRMRITGVDAWLKLGLDYILSIALITMLSRLMGLVVLLLRLRRQGNAIQGHPVLGRTRRYFSTLKFRSGLGAGSTLERWLYVTGLDKLPQLFNVLSGNMSLVGPRTVPDMCEKAYAGWLPNLLTVKPGIVGPWVMLSRSNVSLEEEMRLNMHYIRNWTIWLDLQILFKSALLALSGRRPRIARSAELAQTIAEEGSPTPPAVAQRRAESARSLP